MASGSSAKIIVDSTIDLAHHLGLRAVAEGVEELALLPELKAAGCDAAQGYGISKPLPSAEITRWLLDFTDLPLPGIAAQDDVLAHRLVTATVLGIGGAARAIEQAA
jgi:hypothetical protein